MSFRFDAAGSREQVVHSLDALTDDQLGSDSLGSELRDTLITYIEGGGEPGPSQRYVVAASGHSNPRSLMSLTVSVTIEAVQPDPPAAQEVPVDTSTETQTLEAQPTVV